MSFANPMLLAGLAALAIPVLLHLMIREERSGQAFPSLMFIRRIPFESRRRRTLRDRALLALRCLALALLVLAFAGPELPPQQSVTPATDWSKDSVLLLDRSASMSPPGRWQAALDAARDRVDRLAGGERMAIVAFAQEADLIAPLQADASLLRGQLQTLSAGSKGTGLGAAFDLANRLLRQSPATEQSILLISDLQESALQKVDRLILDRRAALEVVAVDTPVDRNAAIMSVSLQQQERGEHALSIRLRNTGVEPLVDTEIAVEIEDRVVERQRIDLLPQAEKILRVPVVLAPDRPVNGLVLLGDDQILADNWHHLVLMPDAPLELALLLDSDRPAAEHAALFVEQAARLASNPRIRTIRPALDAERRSALASADIVIASASNAIRQPLRVDLHDFVEQGGGLLLVMDDAATAAERDPTAGYPQDADLLRGIGGLRRFPGNGSAIQLSPGVDGQPFRRAIGDDVWAALAGTQVFMARDYDSEDAVYPSKVLARLSDGEPWLIEQSIGRGRLLIMTTGLGSAWSNLVLETGFLPLLHETMRYLGSRPAAALSYTLGEVVDLRRQVASLPGARDWRGYLAAGGALVIEPPGQGQRRLAAGEYLYQPGVAGVYQVHRVDGRPPRLLFAVNPASTESLLASADEASLRSRITRRPAPRHASVAASDGDDTQAGAPPGWYLLGIAAILFWLEAQLANRLSQRRAQAPRTGTTPVENAGG